MQNNFRSETDRRPLTQDPGVVPWKMDRAQYIKANVRVPLLPPVVCVISFCQSETNRLSWLSASHLLYSTCFNYFLFYYDGIVLLYIAPGFTSLFQRPLGSTCSCSGFGLPVSAEIKLYSGFGAVARDDLNFLIFHRWAKISFGTQLGSRLAQSEPRVRKTNV